MIPRTIRESKTLDYIGSSPEHLIQVMQAFLDTHEQCYLDFDCEHDYYDSRKHVFAISGIRPITKEELAEERKKDKIRQERINQQKKDELEKARKILREAGEL